MLLENILIKKVKGNSGTSESTNEPWANYNLLLVFEDESGKNYINAVVDEDVWQQLGYEEGQVVSLNLRFRTKTLFSGFVKNDIRVFIPKNS